ncbi:MAG TPA: BTAD domain-containing putative transcriptional regulator, partial [Candidatus Baltobacteraceae bacterium]|nr:BTAD domain-containing putative transcriptional regulator [Candidatus Baltobacteraceae bacterium]
TSYVPLKRHLYEQLVETLPHDQLAVLVTAAAVNATDETLLQGVLPATNVRGELRSLQARGLLVERGVELIISPLLARALHAYRGDDIKRYAAGTIDSFVEAGDYLSAARIALEAGNTDEAIVYLSRLPADAMILSSPSLTDVIRNIPAELITVIPRLWIAVSFFRHFEVDTEVMIAEAEMLLSYIAADEDPDIVKALRGAKAYLHMHNGEFEVAEELLQEQYGNGLPSSHECTRADAFFLGTFAYGLAQKGETARASQLIAQLSQLTSVPFVSYVMNLIDIRRARHAGNWKAQRAFLDRLLHAGRTRHPLAQARALHELAQGALVSGDIEALESARTSLRDLAQRHDIGPFEAYAAVAGAPAAREVRFGTGQQRAQMHLIESFYAGSAEEARACLTRCMEESDTSLAFFGRIVARAGLAELLPHRRQALIAEAKAVAASFGSRELDNALSHMAIGELPAPGQPMRALMQRFRMLASRVNELLPIEIHAASATVQRSGQAINVSRRVFDLFLALAVRVRPIERDELCEMLWPDQLPAEAANALKMTIRRARLQTGDPTCIQVMQNRYSLGSHVTCDFRELRSEIEPLLKNAPGLLARREDVLAFVRTIARGLPAHLSEFEWFVGTAASLQNLAIEASAALARLTLDHRDFEFGAQLASAMLEADPCDELAWELRIRALLHRGEAPAALRAYRDYAAYARDAHVEVSPVIRNLVKASA